MVVSLNPIIDNGLIKGSPSFAGGKLHCHCTSQKVEVTLTSNVLHNHICGCSKCWKPSGSLFSVVGVVPIANLTITANQSKLHILDPSATIQRNACKDCGVVLFGRIITDHAFKGLDFVHVELSNEKGWQEPQFAGFVSSIVEQGYDPEDMGNIRKRLNDLGLQTYDCLNPTLMDALATFSSKQSKL